MKSEIQAGTPPRGVNPSTAVRDGTIASGLTCAPRRTDAILVQCSFPRLQTEVA